MLQGSQLVQGLPRACLHQAVMKAWPLPSGSWAAGRGQADNGHRAQVQFLKYRFLDGGFKFAFFELSFFFPFQISSAGLWAPDADVSKASSYYLAELFPQAYHWWMSSVLTLPLNHITSRGDLPKGKSDHVSPMKIPPWPWQFCFAI